MASSGSFNTAGYEGRYLQFAWSIPDGGQSISDNKTKINWTLTGKGTGQSGYYMSGNFKVVIDGTTVFQSADRIQLWDGTLVASGSVTLSHGSDGTGSFSASAEAGIYTYDVNCSGSGSWSLPAIARASAISSAGNITLGNKCSVKWTPKHKSFGYKLKFSMGSWSYTTGAIVPGTTAAYTYTGYTIPLAAANQIPNSKTGTMTVKLYSYTSSACTAQIGTEDSKTFTITVPSNAGPTAAMELSPVTSLGAPFDALYLQGKSKALADLSGSTAKYGASIASGSFTALGKKDGSSPYRSGLLNTSGDIEVKGTVTDSRGYSASITKTISVIPYSIPAVIPYTGEKSIICQRCTEDGTVSHLGTKLRIKAGRLYSKVVSDGAQKNFCLLGYRYAASGDSYPDGFTTLIAKTDTASDVIDITITDITLSLTSSYSVQLYVEDDVGSSAVLTFAISTGIVTMHLKAGGKGAAFGKYAENDNMLDIAFDTNLRGDVFGRVYGLGKAETELQSGADLNDLKTFGRYAVRSNAIAATLLNSPTDQAGAISVESSNGVGENSGENRYFLQTYKEYTGKFEHRRMLKVTSTGEWSYADWTTFCATCWQDLGLSSAVTSDGSNAGRYGIGCAYRVTDGGHVHVAFNCAFSYAGNTVQVNGEAIPSKYRPPRNIYAMCATGGRAVARALVNSSGNVIVDWIQILSSSEATTASTVGWIDGYIDYFV